MDEIEPRTRAGDAFTAFVVEVAGLGHFLTDVGEDLAREGGQSLARWVVLEAIAAEPATISAIGRRRGMARQPVQRIGDVLVSDGLAAYHDNPNHRRAKLLSLTPRGHAVLSRIAARQKSWADAHGAAIGSDALDQAREQLAGIRSRIAAPPPARQQDVAG
jgi:DNA-binding MarR family transcriptional regulator